MLELFHLDALFVRCWNNATVQLEIKKLLYRIAIHFEKESDIRRTQSLHNSINEQRKQMTAYD